MHFDLLQPFQKPFLSVESLQAIGFTIGSIGDDVLVLAISRQNGPDVLIDGDLVFDTE